MPKKKLLEDGSQECTKRLCKLDQLASIYSREDIEVLYIREKLVQRQIANRLGTTVKTVRKLLRRYEITHRHYGSRTPPNKKVPDGKTLAHLYLKRRLTMTAIAALYGVTAQAVQYGLKRAGVSLISKKITLERETLYSLYVESRLSFETIAKKLKVPASHVEKEIRRHKIRRPLTLDRLASLHSRAEVERIYVTEGLTQGEAAAKLGTTITMFHALLTRYGITYRHPRMLPKFDIREDDLRRLYVDERRTLSAIAEFYGCARWTVIDRLRKFGIPRGGYRRDPK